MRPIINQNKPKANAKADKSKLRLIKNLHLLTWLKSWHTQIRTAITAERIPQSTAPTRARLALDCKIELVQIVRLQLQHVQIAICFVASLFILCFQPVCEAACAVFAGAAATARFGLAFRGWMGRSVSVC